METEKKKRFPIPLPTMNVDLAGSGLHRGRLAGAQLAVDFQQALFLILGGILFQSSEDALIVAKEVQDVLIGGQAQCTAQHRDPFEKEKLSCGVPTNMAVP